MLNPTPQNGTDRRFVAYQRDSSVPGWYVSSYENVSPFEAQVIAERSHSCHKEIESAQVKAATLREKAAALDFSLRVYAKRFNHHYQIWAKANEEAKLHEGFLEQSPFIRPWLNNVLLLVIFGSEVGMNQGLLSVPLDSESASMLVAIGIAAISFGAGKAAAVSLRRIKKGDLDFIKEKWMLVIGLLAMAITLVAMVLARSGNPNLSGSDHSMAWSMALLQMAFFIVAMFVTYVALPRNREIAASKDACNNLMKNMEKLLNERAALSSRFNVIQRKTQAIVESEKATARALLAEYWQTINANSENSIGTPAQWNDAWFPPLSLGNPLEDHPATIEELLASQHHDTTGF